MKKKIILISIILIGFISYSGVIRHDVSEEKYVKLANQPQFDCVGQIHQTGEDGGGSCVLITSKHILTAAHIFVESDEKTDTTIDIQGKQVDTYVSVNKRVADLSNYRIQIGDKKFKGKELTLHPNYFESEGNYDLAIVELETEIQAIRPASINHKLDELHSKVVGVGFGATGIANKPQTVKPSAKKLAGQNVVDSIGGYQVKNRPALLLCDFDHPNDTTCCNKMGSPKPQPLEYIATGGDSGCGLFRESNNKWHLIGILSGGGIDLNQFFKAGYYGQVMEFTRVALFTNWIENEIKN